MPQTSPTGIRTFRSNPTTSLNHESSSDSERVPFLTQEQSFISSPDLENGAYRGPSADRSDASKSLSVTTFPLAAHTSSFEHVTSRPSCRWRWTESISSLAHYLGWSHPVVHKEHPLERVSSAKSYRSTPLRKVLRLLALALMLLGLLEFIILTSGLLAAFFPDDSDDEFNGWHPTGRLSRGTQQWPTDFSADIHPVACHSHNDYWRKEPLFSALRAGCTGVEADVWLYDEELYVGHSTASLTPERTLRNLYIQPLLKVLDQQNPITSLHRLLDIPRNGVFDTDPAQTLVLLIDFKNEGRAIWPYVVEQLEPLREKKFLTYFNGSTVVEGPITVVATGNAPFNMVVGSPHYRDIFFDAPLNLMDQLSDLIVPPAQTHSLDGSQDSVVEKRAADNQGQGHSGAAPSNAAIYSPANSYYASVDFTRSIGWPWRGYLSHGQKEKIRKQVAGAHARGLKVRYWGVPSWPKGMRNYLWRVLYREGVDYLNVDDLRDATKGTWNWGKKSSWFSGPWRFWSTTAIS